MFTQPRINPLPEWGRVGSCLISIIPKIVHFPFYSPLILMAARLSLPQVSNSRLRRLRAVIMYDLMTLQLPAL